MGDLTGLTLGERYQVTSLVGRGPAGPIYEGNQTSSPNEQVLLTHLEALSTEQLPEVRARVDQLVQVAVSSPVAVVELLACESPSGEIHVLVERRPGTAVAPLVQAGTRTDEVGTRNLAHGLLGMLAALQALPIPVVHGAVSASNLWSYYNNGLWPLYLTGFAPACIRGVVAPNLEVAGPHPVGASITAPATFASDVYGAVSVLALSLTAMPPEALPRKGGQIHWQGLAVGPSRTPLTPAFAAWLARALATDPRRRFSTAKEALVALDAPAARPTWALSPVRIGSAGLLVAMGVLVAYQVVDRLIDSAVMTELDAAVGGPAQVSPLFSFEDGMTGIFSVAHSADGKRLLTTHRDGSVRLWDLETKGEPITFRAANGLATDAIFIDDARIIVSDSGGARVLKLEDQSLEYTFDGHHGPVFAMRRQPNGPLVATAGADGFVRLWEPGVGEKQALEHGGGRLLSVLWTADGKRVLSGGNDGQIIVWDAATGKSTVTMKGHTGPVDELVLGPGAGEILSASDDRSIRRFRIEDAVELSKWSHHSDEAWAIAASPDRTMLVSASKDDTIVWFTPGQTEPIRRQKAFMGGVTSLEFSPDGTMVAAGGAGNILRMWSVPGKLWRPPLPPDEEWREPAIADDLTPNERVVEEARRLINRGSENRDQFAAAEAMLNKVLAADEKYAPAYVQLARIEAKRGYLVGEKYTPESLARAAKLLDKALIYDPQLSAAHVVRGWHHKFQGKLPQAIESADTALKINPQSFGAGQLRAKLALQHEFRLDLALATARTFIEAPNGEHLLSGWLLYRSVAYSAQEWDAVELSHEADLRLQPNSAWVLGNYASFLLQRRDDPERAIAMAERALAISEYPVGRKLLKDAKKRRAEKLAQE